MQRFAIIGPTYPYRGGIAHHTTLLAQHLGAAHEVLFISFSRQYPAWLFPGRSDRDPSSAPLQASAEYLLNPLNPLSWRRTLRRLREWGPDGVILPWWHHFFTPAWAALGRGIKRLPGSPQLIFICHNVLPHERGALGRLLPTAVRTALRRGDRFILHAQTDAAILRRLLPGAAVRVTPHPTYAALGERASLPPVPLPEDKPLLLFCGFVRPYKGLDILLAALARLLPEQPLHLLVAGEIWQGGRELYEQQIERLGIGDAVTIWDAYLPDDQLAGCIRRADLVVLPYRSATQSGVIQLAFGQEKPVITTAVGGLGEVVEDGHTGFVVPPEDPAALAAAIARFFREERGAAMTGHIRAAAGRFSWEAYVRQVIGESGSPV